MTSGGSEAEAPSDAEQEQADERDAERRAKAADASKRLVGKLRSRVGNQ